MEWSGLISKCFLAAMYPMVLVSLKASLDSNCTGTGGRVDRKGQDIVHRASLVSDGKQCRDVHWCAGTGCLCSRAHLRCLDTWFAEGEVHCLQNVVHTGGLLFDFCRSVRSMGEFVSALHCSELTSFSQISDQ